MKKLMGRAAEIMMGVIIIVSVFMFAFSLTYQLERRAAPEHELWTADNAEAAITLEKYFQGETLQVGEDFWIKESGSGWDINSRAYSERMRPFQAIFESHLGVRCGDESCWHEYFQSAVLPELFHRYEVRRQQTPKT